MNLYERIEVEMKTDEEDREKISRKLEVAYDNKDNRKVIDDIFITLTGWSMETLLKQCDQKKGVNDESGKRNYKNDTEFEATNG